MNINPTSELALAIPFFVRMWLNVRFRQESLSEFSRNCWPFSARMSVRFAQEYAVKVFLVFSSDINPREWLTDEMTRIPYYNNDYSLDLADLLPHNWKAARDLQKTPVEIQ